MITRVQVKNYRSLADVDISLGPLTVLVGCNGAGKSAFLDVLRFVRTALRPGLETAISERGGMASLRRWSPNGKTDDIEIALTAKGISTWSEYAFVIGTQVDGRHYVKKERCRIGKTPDIVEKDYEIQDGKWIIAPPNSYSPTGRFVEMEIESNGLMLPILSSFMPDFTHLLHFLININVYSIFPDRLRDPKKAANEYPLREDGENIASALRRLKGSKWFPDILSALNRICFGISDIRVEELGGYLITSLKHDEGDGHHAWFELAQESDGTIRLLGLLIALYQEGLHTLTAIEEPELTLHPGALGILSEIIRETSQRHQVLITTQSPDLISRFGADELRIVEKINGMTQIGTLDKTQREAINEQLFSAGDLLRIEGLHREPVIVSGAGDA